MRWPWDKRALDKAHQGLEKAEREAEEAARRRYAVERLAAQSKAVSSRLRKEVDRNGFTELFLEAMGRRS